MEREGLHLSPELRLAHAWTETCFMNPPPRRSVLGTEWGSSPLSGGDRDGGARGASSPLPELPPELSKAQLMEMVRVDQRERFMCGVPLHSTEYIKQYSFLRDDAELAFELVYREFLLREELGQKPTLEDFERRYPLLAPLLRQQIRAHKVLSSPDLAVPPPPRRTPAPQATRPLLSMPPHGEAPPAIPTGPTVVGCSIMEEIGRGVQGIVYKVWHHGQSRLFAMRMLVARTHERPDELRRFIDDVKAAVELQHPNIIQVHEVGLAEGVPYYMMEFVEGVGLAKITAGRPQLDLWAARLVEVVARAIHYGHEQGVLHGNLKPSCILLDAKVSIEGHRLDQNDSRPSTMGEFSSRGDRRNLKIGNPRLGGYGLAPRIDQAHHPTGNPHARGTPPYMAPEMADGSVPVPTAAQDIYGLGAILYELLTGRPPYLGPTEQLTLHQVIAANLIPPSRLQPLLHPDLEAICLKCLDPRPARRYATARDLADDLVRFQKKQRLQARRPGRGQLLWRWTRQHPREATTLLALFAFLFFTSAVSWFTAIYSSFYSWTARQDRGALVQERDTAQTQVANLFLKQAQAEAEQADVARALTWMLNSLQAAPRDATDFQHLVRRNLSAWMEQGHPLRFLLDHEDRVLALAVRPDGKSVASVADGIALQEWNVATGRPLDTSLHMKGRLAAVALSHDGSKVLLTQQKERIATLYAIKGGKRLGKPLPHSGPIQALTISQDGKMALVAGSNEKTGQGEGWFWNVATGEALGKPMLNAEPILSVAISPDGRTAVFGTGTRDKPTLPATAVLWNIATAQAMGSPVAHAGPVNAVAFSVDGKSFATASFDGTVQVCSAVTGKPLLPALAHPQRVHAVAFSPEGTSLATGCEDGWIRFWNLTTGQSLGNPLRHDAAVAALDFTPDGRYLFSGSWDRTVRQWERARPWSRLVRRVETTNSARYRAAAWSPDRKNLLLLDTDGVAWLLDLASGQAPTPLGKPSNATLLAFSADGRFAAAAGSATLVWEVATRQLVQRPFAHNRPVSALAFSPDGKLLATAEEREVQVWDLGTGRLARASLVQKERVTALTWASDGRRLAVAAGAEARQWDLTSGLQVGQSMGHKSTITLITCSADGKVLLSGSRDGTMSLWDATTGAPQGSVRSSAGVSGLAAFSPNCESVVTVHGSVARMWDVPGMTPKKVTPLIHPRDRRATAVAWSPDGQTLLLGYDDGSARLYDPATGQPIGPWILHRGAVLSVDFAEEGKFLRTAAAEGSYCITQVPGPLEEPDLDRLRLQVELQTCLQVDDTQTITPLDAESWRQRRKQLEDLSAPKQ